MSEVLFESALTSLPLRCRGKVRDVYDVDDEHLLIVATDRLSAFDVVLPTPIPGKGRLLTAMAEFWFRRTRHIIPNHLQLAEKSLDEALPDAAGRAQVQGRAMVARRLQALPVEAIVRGYLIGSGWKDYRQTGAVCGIRLPQGLRLADKLAEPVYTPSTKAAAGDHDENVDFAHTVALLGAELAVQVRDVSLALYRYAAAYAARRGIIVADTKFEFGLSGDGRLVLMDEIFTPDSSRFWPADGYRPGVNPPSYDKQFVRDYLETLGWDKTPPGPPLPEQIVSQTAARYQEALARLTAP
ncbi:MAG: phosphoribosylaminoimidazolesuccinocarboxamide synthase [Pseudomonadota bacterium]|nr:phosphoribosylaminoimidazolesuccinocarboxamide synthase [Pseudomonadota bacterium]